MLSKIKCALVGVPLLAASSFAAWTPAQTDVDSVAGELSDWGGYVIKGIGIVIVCAAGLRLLVKGINRAVGK